MRAKQLKQAVQPGSEKHGSPAGAAPHMHEIKPGQSVVLLKALHILTQDGKMNQDSRRKLKQVNHLVQFIEPLLEEILLEQPAISLVDHGAGKSYLGFLLYDLFFKARNDASHIYGIETRAELVTQAQRLAADLQFSRMSFLNLSVAQSIGSDRLPEKVDVVTALHACDTATDDAIHFALEKHARCIILVPCCQAEIAAVLKKNKSRQPVRSALAEMWRHPLHTREFGSQVTNVLRCLQLEAHGYQVSVTELVGWEHSMKNELIIATYRNLPRARAGERLQEVLATLGLEEMACRFFPARTVPAAQAEEAEAAAAHVVEAA
ncbi:MAG: SAM-dependent methyltransferase [Herminiimonas sp.]|nr:SAM-dependent methyltransferase [Herminiimonas sp.]